MSCATRWSPRWPTGYTTGINNFLQVLRFDENDVVSNTNEVEYGLTQRLFRHFDSTRACHAEELPQGPGLSSEAVSEPVPDDTPGKGCGNEELISWRLTQKYFFDPTFGNAIQNGRRNVFSDDAGSFGRRIPDRAAQHQSAGEPAAGAHRLLQRTLNGTSTTTPARASSRRITC